MSADDYSPKILITPDGVRFGLVGEKPDKPAPVLFISALAIEETLAHSRYAYDAIGQILAPKGFLIVALDSPCLGEDKRFSDMETSLLCWRARMDNGEDVAEAFVRQSSGVLDWLVGQKYVDPGRVVACGTSRGGFLSFHWAARDERVRCVVGFSPVTDLKALREFADWPGGGLVEQLNLIKLADKLAGRPVWITIGNNDERVDTDKAIAFSRELVKAAKRKGRSAQVELIVSSAPEHGQHPTAYAEAAQWVEQMLKD